MPVCYCLLPPPWDSFSTVGWCHRWMWSTQTGWKALKWLSDRVDWTELIQARVEVEKVQTATQICVPSVRVAVATQGLSIWLLSHSYKLSSVKPCLLPGVLMYSSTDFSTSTSLWWVSMQMFISIGWLPDNVLLSDGWLENWERWPHPHSEDTKRASWHHPWKALAAVI